MSNLQYRQTKIQEKRKQTVFRDFLMEIGSWDSVGFYKKNGITGKYPDTDRVGMIVPHKTYNELGDQMMDDIVTGTDFMVQYTHLWLMFIHRPTIQQGINENSEYVEMAFGLKNGYLAFTSGIECENILYSNYVYGNCRNVINSVQVINNCENVYSSRSIVGSFNVFYSVCIKDGNNIRFSNNLIGCSDCIHCSGLQNQSYCINNQQLSREDFLVQKQQILQDISGELTVYRNRATTYFDYGNSSVSNVKNIICSTDIENAYDLSYVVHGRNIVFAHGIDRAEYMYDSLNVGSMVSTHFYGAYNAGNLSNHIYCCADIDGSSNLYYCYDLEACSFCLGCIGLKNKSYCILNKQYSKEEWYQKVDEIFQKMEDDGTLGQFFPATMNPFYFNDTAAYLIDPSFTKEEVTAAGYLWRDEPINVDISAGAEVVKTSELGQYEGRKDEQGNFTSLSVIARNEDTSDAAIQGAVDRHASLAMTSTRWIDPTIKNKIIQDPEGNVYRIVPMEYEFLMKHGLPLPRKHWLDRMKENFRII